MSVGGSTGDCSGDNFGMAVMKYQLGRTATVRSMVAAKMVAAVVDGSVDIGVNHIGLEL